MTSPDKPMEDFLNAAVSLLEQARRKAVSSVNRAMVLTYYRLGEMIVLREQGGEERAEYSARIIETLAERLTAHFGKGFSGRNLRQMRQFYLVYRIRQTVSAKFDLPDFTLSWSHYQILMRIDNEQARSFYQIESQASNWSVRELKRQINSGLFERLSLSRDKEAVKELSTQGLIINRPEDAIKEPYVLEFLGLDVKNSYSESDLESAIIDKLEQFLLELGKGFTFVARQKRISFDERHFYIDLVFYNRLLRAFVLVDLKIGDLKHQDIGQLQMYVNYYDREVKLAEENPTIGLILCKDKSDLLVQYTLPENNDQIFASRYKTVLPSKQELSTLLH